MLYLLRYFYLMRAGSSTNGWESVWRPFSMPFIGTTRPSSTPRTWPIASLVGLASRSRSMEARECREIRLGKTLPKSRTRTTPDPPDLRQRILERALVVDG